LQRIQEVPFQELRSEFRIGFEAVRNKVLQFAQARVVTVGGKPLTGHAMAALLRRLVETLNANTVLNAGTAWEQVQHSTCEALARELRGVAGAAIQAWREGQPLPCGRPLPVRDDLLTKALKELRRALRQDWRARALGDDSVRNEYWVGLRSGLADEEQAMEQLNLQLAEEKLRGPLADWVAWLTQESQAASTDPRSEALCLLLDQGLPARAMERVAREALHQARLARLRWDSAADAHSAELKLVQAELASKVATVEAAGRLDDAALEQTREVGRLQGQVEALLTQIRQGIQRERSLREQVLQAEEATRKEQRLVGEAKRKGEELDDTAKRLNEEIAKFRAEERRLREEAATAQQKAAEPERKPKCGCAVM